MRIDDKKRKKVIYMPRAPYFSWRGRGKVQILLNGQLIPSKKKLMECRERLDELIATPDYEIKLRNKRQIEAHEEFIKGTFSGKKDGKRSNTDGYIYVLKIGKFYKIGRTRYLKDRINKYITENPEKIEVIHTFLSSDTVKDEREIHRIFESLRLPERKEWFKLDKRDVEWIKKTYGR